MTEPTPVIVLNETTLKRLKCDEMANSLSRDDLPIELKVIVNETLHYALHEGIDMGLKDLKDLRVIADLIKNRNKRVSDLRPQIDEDLKHRLAAAKMLYSDPDKKRYYGSGYKGMMLLAQKLGARYPYLDSEIVESMAGQPSTSSRCVVL